MVVHKARSGTTLASLLVAKGSGPKCPQYRSGGVRNHLVHWILLLFMIQLLDQHHAGAPGRQWRVL